MRIVWLKCGAEAQIKWSWPELMLTSATFLNDVFSQLFHLFSKKRTFHWFDFNLVPSCEARRVLSWCNEAQKRRIGSYKTRTFGLAVIRVRKGVCMNTCLAYGEVQQVSQGVMDHADIIGSQHQRSTSSAQWGTNPLPKRGGVRAARSHHPCQLRIRRWSSPVCDVRWAVSPRIHEGPLPAAGCILPLGMVVTLLLSFLDEGPNRGSPQISKPRMGLEDSPQVKRSSAEGGVDPNCDCNLHGQQTCEVVLGSSAGHLEETGNLGTMIIGRHFIREARSAFLHGQNVSTPTTILTSLVLHICVYVFIIFLLMASPPGMYDHW